MTYAVKQDLDRTNRGWSLNLWGNCPFQDIQDDPRLGFAFYDDFVHTNAADWTTNHIAGTSTVAKSSSHRGLLVLSAGAATDTHGGNLGLGGATSSFVTPAADRQIWLEWLHFPTVQVTTLGSSFMGLSTQPSTTVPLTTTGALATSIDRIGFSSLDSINLKFNYLRSGATAYLGSTLDTQVTGEWMKLGFFIDGLTSVTPYINSVAQDKIVATSTVSLPNAVMNLAFSTVSGGGTVTPLLTFDWVRFACLDQASDIVTL
jgi:hypothetical protein